MSNFVNDSLYSTSQVANGEQFVGVILAMSVIFLIVLVAVSYKLYEIGQARGKKDAKDELQEHVLRSQIMRELGMSAPAKGSDNAGTKPVVMNLSSTAEATSAAPLPVLPPIPVTDVAAVEATAATASANEEAAPAMSDEELVEELERGELAAAR